MILIEADIARHLQSGAEALAAEIVERLYEAEPELQQRYGQRGREHCLEDARFHLQHLASALDCRSPALFVDYVEWAARLLEERRIARRDLEHNLAQLNAVLEARLPHGSEAVLQIYIGPALARLSHATGETSSFMDPMCPCARLRDEYFRLVLRVQRRKARDVILSAVDGGLTIESVYLRVLQPVQYEVGRLWHMNRLRVAQEHFCTAVAQSIIAELYPRLFEAPRVGRRAVIASVGPDLHEMGGRIVADLLELAGWDTIYLGGNTPGAEIAAMAARHQADLVGLSATMTYHIPRVRHAIAAVRSLPDCSKARIIVGGRPFLLEPSLWRELGADGSASDGREAVRLAADLTKWV